VTETLTALGWDEDKCPVCGGTGFVPVLVFGFFTTKTERRPCTAPIHQKEE
jgi:hypothetical protein